MAKRRISTGVDVDRLDQLIRDLGVRVRIYKSAPSPNMDSIESMNQDVNDPTTKHNMLDFDCFDTVALFQQQELKEQFNLQGTFHIDEVLITFLSGQTLAPYARIELLDFEEDFYQLIPRQVGTDIDYLKYPACEVLGLFTYNKSTQTNERYYWGVDFELTEEGNIKWIGSHKPNDKQVFTVYYRHRPVYRAIKAVHRDRFSQKNIRPENINAPKKTINGSTYVKLPETWVVKRDFLVERPKNQLPDPNA